MKRILAIACAVGFVLAGGVLDAIAINDTNLVMHIGGNQLERITRESQENWNHLADGTGALTNGLTVIGNTAVTGTLAATSIDAGSLTDVTLSDGQVLDSADTTNVTLTAAERALSRLTLVSGGTTNAASDDVSWDVRGKDAFGTNTVYMRINTDFTDVAPGTQDATVTVAIPVAGALTTRVTLGAGGVTLAGATTLTITNVYYGAASDVGWSGVTTQLTDSATTSNVLFWYKGAVTNIVTDP
jgi:hypothetical protein